MSDRTITVRVRSISDQYRRDMQGVAATTGAAGTAQGRMVTQTGRLGGAVRGIIPLLGAAGLLRVVQNNARAAMEFEDSVTALRTQIGLAEPEVRRLAEASREVGRATGIGAQEAVDASWKIASAGLRGQDAIEALERSAQAARIGLGDTATVAGLVTAAMNAYGPEVLSASEATDILLAAVREGTAEADQLAGALGQVIPIASEMGITFDQVAGMVAAMTRTGTDAGTATIQLRQVMMNLLKPTEQARDALAEVGLSAQGLRDQIREEGLFDTLMTLREAFGDNEEAMGQVFANARSLMGVLDLLGANMEENRKVVENTADSVGLLDEGIEEVENTTSDKLRRVGAEFKDLGLAVGGPVKSAFDGLLDSLLLGFDAASALRSELGRIVPGDAPGVDHDQVLGHVDIGDLPPQQVPRDVELTLRAASEAERFDALRRHQDQAAGSARTLAERLRDVHRESRETRSAIGDLIDVFRDWLGGTMDAEKAAIRFEEAMARVRTTVQDAGASIDITTEAGRRNRQAVIDATEALWGDIAARREAGASTAELIPVIEEHVARLRDTMRQAGLTEDQIDELIETYGLVPDEIITQIGADIDQAENELLRFEALARHHTRDRTVNVRVRTHGMPGEFLHSGGVVGQGQPRRLHGGGSLSAGDARGGLAPDERLVIGQVGEVMLSRTQVSMLQTALGALPRLHGGGPVPQASQQEPAQPPPSGGPTSATLSGEVRARFEDDGGLVLAFERSQLELARRS